MSWEIKGEGGKELTDSDAELIAGYDSPADLARRDLGHV